MLQYLIILLDDTSTAFCHADNPLKDRRLIDIQVLKDAIFFAMKEKLNVQFVYPDYELPQEYVEAIETIDHIKIKRFREEDNVDVFVVDEIAKLSLATSTPVVLRCSKQTFIEQSEMIAEAINGDCRLNVVVTDIDTLKESEQEAYSAALCKVSQKIQEVLLSDKNPQINILTDRLVLDKMNNCNAGVSSITLAPNGKFYICPGFYYDECCGCGADFFGEDHSVGNLQKGIELPNQQLYRLEYAPICRTCDAFHCKRCIWMNRKTTREVNTPSHEQCVAAHLERNQSKVLQNALIENKGFKPINVIDEMDSLDPYFKIKR